jgi:hypothetical protein
VGRQQGGNLFHQKSRLKEVYDSQSGTVTSLEPFYFSNSPANHEVMPFQRNTSCRQMQRDLLLYDRSII